MRRTRGVMVLDGDSRHHTNDRGSICRHVCASLIAAVDLSTHGVLAVAIRRGRILDIVFHIVVLCRRKGDSVWARYGLDQTKATHFIDVGFEHSATYQRGPQEDGETPPPRPRPGTARTRRTASCCLAWRGGTERAVEVKHSRAQGNSKLLKTPCGRERIEEGGAIWGREERRAHHLISSGYHATPFCWDR